MGRLLESAAARDLLARWPRALVITACQQQLNRLRRELFANSMSITDEHCSVEAVAAGAAAELERRLAHSLRPVINATGVLLQTNLGRAPLSEAAIENVVRIARGYANVEFRLATGSRGRRDEHIEPLLLELIAARSAAPSKPLAATVVNNCAAATFLAVQTLAAGGEVIVSRGESVEIGGGFRVPEIIERSGATLREVGTTNRTRLSDYTQAITPQTRMILRVHRSNFRIDGFTEQPSLVSLVELGERAGLPVFHDQGTGCILRLEDHGICDESNWLDSIASGASLIAASGDKLLGGPQCGLLVGAPGLIAQLRANPLARAMRPGKLTLAALSATLLEYLEGREHAVPVVAMLSLDSVALRERCDALTSRLSRAGFDAATVASESVTGGGTTPGAALPSFAIALAHRALREAELARRLRTGEPPVVARTQHERVLLDLRTVPAEMDDALAAAVEACLPA